MLGRCDYWPDDYTLQTLLEERFYGKGLWCHLWEKDVSYKPGSRFLEVGSAQIDFLVKILNFYLPQTAPFKGGNKTLILNPMEGIYLGGRHNWDSYQDTGKIPNIVLRIKKKVDEMRKDPKT